MKDIYLSGPTRTPIGRHGGSFAAVSAVELGSQVVAESLSRSDVDGKDVDEVLIGNVLSAGLGQNVARQVAVKAGVPQSVGATTINKVCGSGLKSVIQASQAIAAGQANIILAGGTENMTRAPFVTNTVVDRGRKPVGDPVDTMIFDGLTDPYSGVAMGTCGDQCASKYAFSREDQDTFAIESYTRARAATSEGRFDAEIVAVGDVGTDEEPQRFDEQKLRSLSPAFDENGTITAGNASSVNDGAAAITVLSKAAAESRKPVARLLGCAAFAREPEWFTLAPIGAIENLFKTTGLAASDVDLFEINEAFSCVTMAAMQSLDLSHDSVNVNGGAVALGHPIGASGTRILVTLLNSLEQRDSAVGVAAICIGGGEALAVAVERV
jgi:acetyl-CoA C-acetyltransferase